MTSPTETAVVSLELFSDYVCPWCYLNAANLEKLSAERPLDITWRAFPLHVDTPQEGMPLARLFNGRDMSAAQAQLEARMAEAGIEYHYCESIYNTRLAQELAKWAATRPGGEALHMALFRGYFVHGRNLADIDVLVEAAEAVGLEAGTARQVLEDRTFAAEVDSDWDLARQYGIGGVPAMVGGGYLLSGSQPLPALERFLDTVAQA